MGWAALRERTVRRTSSLLFSKSAAVFQRHSAIGSISASVKPLEEIAAVPIRTPEVMKWGRGSFGIAFRFSVMCTSSQRS